jgi:hypothetical protein
MTVVSKLLELVDRVATGRNRLVGLSVIRVGFAATTALLYLANMRYRNVLYGPQGQVDFKSFSASQHTPGSVFSLYALNDGETWFNIVYFSGLAAALVWMVYGGHVLTLVNAAFVWSIHQRNPNVLDGGDNLERILLLLLLFTTTNAYLSPVASRVRARLATIAERPALRNSLHNAAATLIVFQICVVYAVAALWKVVDTRWREGNALFYITQVRQFQYTNVVPSLMHNPVLVTAMTYLTVAAQLSVVLAVATRRRWLRELILLVVVGMHVGIMFAMGLVSFGLFMIAADAVLLTDGDYLAAVRWFRARLTASRGAPAGLTGSGVSGNGGTPGNEGAGYAPGDIRGDSRAGRRVLGPTR